MRHIIAMLMENQPGGLARVVGLFSQRGYNIESLNVSPTDDLSLSRVTLTVNCDSQVIKAVCRHLNRLVDVYKVQELSNLEYIGRDLVLIKLRIPEGDEREQLRARIALTMGQLIDISAEVCIAQFSGNREQVADFFTLLDRDCILETAKSGVVGMSADADPLAES